MQRACRPCCVDEFVVKTLLNVVDNPLLILGHGFGEQAYSRAFFDDDALKARPDCREHISGDKNDDTFLVSISHGARRFAGQPFLQTVRTSRDALSNRQVAAREETTAQQTARDVGVKHLVAGGALGWKGRNIHSRSIRLANALPLFKPGPP